MSVEKPPYELSALYKAVAQCDKNIDAFRSAIAKEEERKKLMEGYIAQHERYEKEQKEAVSLGKG